jgi:hypothetical protein
MLNEIGRLAPKWGRDCERRGAQGPSVGKGKAILAVVEGRESSDGFIGFIPEVCLKAALPTA